MVYFDHWFSRSTVQLPGVLDNNMSHVYVQCGMKDLSWPSITSDKRPLCRGMLGYTIQQLGMNAAVPPATTRWMHANTYTFLLTNLKSAL